MQKPFLTYQQQLNKLKNEKKLLIPDMEYAELMLQRHSYYALIGGYKTLYQNSTTKKYKDNTTFDEIVALYQFDAQLREILLSYLFKVERHIRSLLSYFFAQEHGETQQAYLSKLNYGTNPTYKKAVNKLICKLQNTIDSKDYPYIEHQRTTYGNVPLWVLINALSFGTVAMMYQLTPKIQSKISKNFLNLNEKELRQHLMVLTKFRNVCAHNERLFSHKSKHYIPDTVLHQKLQIPKRGSQYIMGKGDLFAVVISMRYLLPSDDFSSFKYKIDKAINKFVASTIHIPQKEILEAMGFPENWKKISSYKL